MGRFLSGHPLEPYNDGLARAIKTVTHPHHEVHSGSHYFVTDVIDLTINQVYDMQFTTPDSLKQSHMLFKVSSESETDMYVYEGTGIIQSASTVINPLNNNRNSSNVSVNVLGGAIHANLAAANAVNLVSAGTEIWHKIIGAGIDSGETVRDNELLLKSNTEYIIRAIANAAGYIAFDLGWYEHTDNR